MKWYKNPSLCFELFICPVYLAAHDEFVVGSHVPYPAASVLSLS